MIDVKIKLYYLLILFTVFMALCIIYAKTNENIGNKREVRSFKGMLLSFMVYGLVDLRLLNDHFYTVLPRMMVLFIMGAGFFSMMTASYFWLSYVTSGIHKKIRKIYIILARVPLVFVAILLFTPLYRYVYTLDEKPTFQPMLGLILLMDYIYLLLATVISIQHFLQEKNRLQRRKYRGQIVYILFYTLSGFLMGYFSDIPTIELCMMPVVIKLFIDLQDARIYTDALTKLENRRRINEYLEEEIGTCDEEHPLTVIMLDIDFFKSINDTLGHEEGDAVLVAFSKALRNLTASKYAMAARWGGDEFLVVGKEKGLAEGFRDKLIRELQANPKLAFLPLFSIGTYNCTASDITVKKVISEADTRLYQDKEIQHKKSEEFYYTLKNIL